MSPQTSRFLDASRWIAALAVLLTHVNAVALVNIGDIPSRDRSLLSYIVWFFYGYAHQAVVVFFVLSGFLVGGNALKAVSAQKRFLTTYAIDRTVRIYVVLIPVLFITMVLDTIGRNIFADTGIYNLPPYANHSTDIILLGNICNVQDIFVPYFGTNSVLWTLAHEYWYYITFAALILPLSNAYVRRTRWIAFSLGLLILITLSTSMSYHLFGFMLWLAGTAVAVMRGPIVKNRRNALVLFLVTAVGIRLGVRYSTLEIWWVGALADAAVAAAFANLLLSVRFDNRPIWAFFNWHGHKVLSDFSYSLYAMHMPIVVFLCAASQHVFGYGFHTIPDAPSKWVAAALILCGAMLATYAFSRLTEARTGPCRTFVRAVFARRTESLGAPLFSERLGTGGGQ